MQNPEFAEMAVEPNFVAFRASDQDYCVDIMDVREIRRWTPATILPESPPFVRGVINLRGSVVPILDFAIRLGLPASEPTERHVVIIVKVGMRMLGLLVDEVSEILNIMSDAIKPTPDMATDKEGSIVSGIIALDERMVRLIDLERICATHDLAEVKNC